ncbi:ABC transporter substrate-binding protein [Caballeronia sp. LZ043]|uniref:ABC transporter substrate-binding protein n=1 Tax=Caballeronia sp. LZ043 TaxID=3038569 RepID=UPI00285D3F9C|nr:ABC transporter substrate-binding protein [Caballeronia sp. LZ043]MDR5822331.1 ABC transporter substrate-binding protein [Caballeronia sp. LZ043]
MNDHAPKSKPPRRPTLLAVSLAMAAAATLAPGFAAHADEAPKVPGIKADTALSALVPKAYRERGTITVAVNPDVAPVKFINDDGNIAGFTPDLLSAAADVLAMKLQLTQTSFDALIPGLTANRFDVLLSLADFPSRHNMVTFVDYLNIGETIVASPSRNLVVESLDDLCGLQVALPRGTATVEEANKLSANCVAQGKKPLSLATYPDTNMTLLSLTTKASDAAWVDSPVANYNASKFPEKYKVVYFNYIAPYGIGFGTDEKGKQMAAAVQQALRKLQKDGVYGMLLKKWGLSTKDSRPTFPINDAKL